MPTVDLTVTITTPVNVTVAEALRLFTDQNGFNASLGVNRAAYAKQIVATKIGQDIRARRRMEAAIAAEVAVPDDISAA